MKSEKVSVAELNARPQHPSDTINMAAVVLDIIETNWDGFGSV